MGMYQYSLGIGTSSVQVAPGSDVYRAKIFSTSADMAGMNMTDSQLLKSVLVSKIAEEGKPKKIKGLILDISNLDDNGDVGYNALTVAYVFERLSRNNGYEAALIANGAISRVMEERGAIINVNVFRSRGEMDRYVKEHGHI